MVTANTAGPTDSKPDYDGDTDRREGGLHSTDIVSSAHSPSVSNRPAVVSGDVYIDTDTVVSGIVYIETLY